jgi:hypothetical protein
MYSLSTSVGLKVWFLEEYWQLLEEANLTRPVVRPRLDCGDPHLWDGVP